MSIRHHRSSRLGPDGTRHRDGRHARLTLTLLSLALVALMGGIPPFQPLFQAIGRRLGCHGSQQYLLAHLGQFTPSLGVPRERIWVATRMVESH